VINVVDFTSLTHGFLSELFPWKDYEVPDLAELAQFMDRREKMGTSGVRSTDCYVSPQAIVASDVIIGAGAQIHEFATVRSGSIVGEGAVIGFGCEVSRSVLGPSCSLTHRATVCSSIVGQEAHLGAGVIIANTHLFDENMRNPTRPITVLSPQGDPVCLEVARFGALIGDGARIGMGAMLGPGTLIGRNSVVYPGIIVGNETIPERKVLKKRGDGYVMHELRHDMFSLVEGQRGVAHG